MEKDEKMEVARKLRVLYARVDGVSGAIKELVGEHFMVEMDEIDDKEAKNLMKAVCEGAMDPENKLNTKVEKLQPWIDKVLKKEGDDGE